VDPDPYESAVQGLGHPATIRSWRSTARSNPLDRQELFNRSINGMRYVHGRMGQDAWHPRRGIGEAAR
jgi:hypothetical protein